MDILFIINPVSGGRSKDFVVKAIEEVLDKSRFHSEIIYTTHAGHATELARDSKADIVVAVGGDGTVSEVAKGLVGSSKAFGIIPCGSGDGLALHLGISRNPRKAVKVLMEGEVVKMDHGLFDGVPFFCTAGVGLDAEVAWQFASSGTRGLWTYISLAWKIWQHFKPDTYDITVDGSSLRTPAVFVTAGNANQWGNQARICDLASVRDAQLDLVVVEPFRTIEIPILAWKLLTGRAHTSRRVKVLRGSHISISRTQEAPAHYDGDPCLKGKEMKLEIVPSALNVVVPKGREI